ncbi:hypothetical protein NESM_000218400 [Novymonas esmeraldas]|uniref:Uncharacterized protein n=1 Tax=Novymonas esmeraldas TaxID=1808958 RepID=A0AAW0F775_9TRYP
MSPPSSVHLSRATLARALAELRRGQRPQHAALSQLQRYLQLWFPRSSWLSVYPPPAEGAAGRATANWRFCRDPPRVSREWAAALELVELAGFVDALSDSSQSVEQERAARLPHSSTPRAEAVVQATEHLLRHGVFPACGWAVSLRLLQAWRERQPPAMAQAFPETLSAPAAAQLLHHISLAPPSPRAWRDALRLYRHCSVPTHTPAGGTAAAFPRSSTPAPPRRSDAEELEAHSAFLKALRHMSLTTLLRAGEWEQGLRFYYHTLYQRDLPGPITTTYLVQQLGCVGQWAAVLQVYELCVKLLQAQQRQPRRAPSLSSAHEGDTAVARQWGTTLSVAMAAAQTSPGAPAGTLAAMLQQLRPQRGALCGPSADGAAAALAPPLVRLDGHFLSAVQALPSPAERVSLVRLARRESLLDVFKLIRGLVSKRRWMEALMLFDEALSTAPVHSSRATNSNDGASPHAAAPPSTGSATLALTKREIGEARLNLLHASTIDCVAVVVAALNRHRVPSAAPRASPSADGASRGVSAAVAAPTQPLLLVLNDREVECVLSKTLALADTHCHHTLPVAAHAARESFWQYCLELLAFNYGAFGEDAVDTKHHDPPGPAGGQQQPSPTRPRRRTPSPAALSFLLRHPRLPWQTALQIIHGYGLLEARPSAARMGVGGSTRRRITSASPSHSSSFSPGETASSRTPQLLAVSAAVELLRSQARREEAERLALQSLAQEMADAAARAGGVVSVSAALLQVAQYSTLRGLLLERQEARLIVDKATLSHLLRESTRVVATRADRCGRGSSEAVQLSSGHAWWVSKEAFCEHPCGRALTVVSLLMQRLQRPQDARAAAGVAVVQPSLSGRPASLFLPVPVDAAPLATAVGVGAPHPSWLLTYPSAVHCEVLRVLACLTTSSADSSPEDASLCYGLRWTWSRRYLAHLAAHFSAAPVCGVAGSQEAPSGEREPATGAAAAAAREAYYCASFEAVLSLLDSVAAGAGASHVDDAPRSPAQRVQQLGQVLERAIVRYGCVPPTHMLLPNQLDRLLPPLTPRSSHSVAEASALGRRDDGDAGESTEERRAVALHLVRLTVGALCGAGAQATVEPVLLHNLLKLSCRVAEHDQASASPDAEEHARDVDCSAEISRIGVSLVRLQCERCGLHTVRPGTVTLLYRLCAAAQSRATRHGHAAPRQAALETTRYLLKAQAQALRAVGAPPQCTDTGARAETAVVRHHCQLYFALFGWEEALEVWYRAFPSEVLSQLSGNPHAVEACLSFGETAPQ